MVPAAFFAKAFLLAWPVFEMRLSTLAQTAFGSSPCLPSVRPCRCIHESKMPSQVHGKRQAYHLAGLISLSGRSARLPTWSSRL